ncbi:MAG: CotH kinase family protein [Bacteroidales bacterium]|nr:CotH kinase family protein [Bacteroidales bacterium]
MRRTKFTFITLAIFCMMTGTAASQVIDTIANWDGINVNWTASGVSTQVVENPDQQGINPSQNCLEAVTSNGQYDLIFTDFSTPVNFGEFPKYRIKILAPPSGGSVLFKFENSTNTSWHEIEKTPAPGQWDDLEFDFSGITATDYVRMVIFFDFLGTTPGNQWYLDDVLRISDGSAGLTSNLPIVIIYTYGMPIPDEPKITGEMYIVDNGPGNLNNQYDPPNGYDGFIGIEIRGQSTQMFPKKSYGFETRDEEGENLDVSLLGMPEENDWILYAPYSDKSMLRNFISFYMGSKLDHYCSRMAYCEVIENNDYKGIYILMEKIKNDDNRVNIATLNPEDISGDELTGGYIVKVDKIDPGFQYGVDGWKSIPNPPYPNAMNITFQYYYPEAEDIVFQQKSYIQNYVSSAENALTGSSYSNPNIGYNKYLNTGSFVDFMILREVAKEVDSYRYSTYFYKEQDSDGGKLFAGPPWDFNLGYANVDYWLPGIDYTGWVYPLVEPIDWGIMFWWKRLMEDSYFRNLSKTRWYELRLDALSDAQLEFAIDSIVGYIYEAQERNFDRWPILGTYVWPNYNWQGNDYDDEVEFFKTWFFNRVSWIDSSLPGQFLDPAAELTGSFPQLEISLSDDYFSREILKKKYFTLNNAPMGMDIDTVVYENASQAAIYLQGSVNYPVEISVTLDAKIINSFSDLTSNEISINVGINSGVVPNVELYIKGNSLIIRCNQPQLLGEEIEIFNLIGKLVNTYSIDNTTSNTITIDQNTGIYFCRYNINGQYLTQRIVIVD